MTYSEEDSNRPISGGFTRAELETMPDSAVADVMRGRLTKEQWLRRHPAAQMAEAARTREAEAAYSMADRPAPAPSQTDGDPYQVTAWGTNEYDFTAPSGQRCRMRNLDEQMLLEAGILEQVTRLPGLVQQGPVRQGQGKPPAPDVDMEALLKQPDKLADMMGVINTLVATVVVKPVVRVQVTDEAPLLPGQVLARSINLGDRMAIMERAMGGVMKLDAFRPGSEGTSERVDTESGASLPAQ